MNTGFLRTLTALGVMALSLPALAETLAAPLGTPILEASGQISRFNAEGAAVFDRDMLEAMGTATVATRTPWFDGVSTFEGVPLETLMEELGATGDTVTAIALNDYVTTIPVEDFAKYGPILALKRDGAYMSVRDKGPLFIIYPYDNDPELRSQVFFSRSAWQVARLVIE